MQILASALPGFRDLRAPLTAGYLWLILLWIVLKPDLATRPANEIAGSVWDLGKTAGPIWIAIAVSVAAYLIGSISQLCSGPLNKAAGLISRIPIPGWVGISSPTDRNERALFGSIERQRDRAMQKLGTPDGPTDDMAKRQALEIANTTDQVQQAARNLTMEIDLPATLLVGKEPELFTEVDRLKAESQLRLAIVPPLLAVIGYVAAEDGWPWFFLVIPVIILWMQGHRRELEFKSLMVSAFQQGLVRSQTLENLKEFVDSLPTIRNQGSGAISIREPTNRDT